MLRSAHRVKVSVTEILLRVSWFGRGVGVWHMWVNAGKVGKFGGKRGKMGEKVGNLGENGVDLGENGRNV